MGRLADNFFSPHAEAVDAYGFELCSSALGISVDSLVTIVYSYRHSEGLLLERLRLVQEAFEKKQQHVSSITQQLDKKEVEVVLVEQSSRETTIEKIRSLVLNYDYEPSLNLQGLLVLVDTCGIQRCASACNVQDSKILEFVSRYRAAMGSRLERLKKKQEALLEQHQQEFDSKHTQQEWGQIYALFNDIQETATTKHNASYKTQ